MRMCCQLGEVAYCGNGLMLRLGLAHCGGVGLYSSAGREGPCERVDSALSPSSLSLSPRQ